MKLKPEHMAAWEHAARKAGAASVEAYAQATLDRLGADLEANRAADDRARYASLFDLSLRLPESERVALEADVRARLMAAGLLEAE